MTIHERIIEEFNKYVEENERFSNQGIKVAATRARKALGEMAKLAKERRKEIMEAKSAE